MKNTVTIGMAGAGRGTELHMEALKRVSGIEVRCRHIISKTSPRLMKAKERFGFERASLEFRDLLEDPKIDVIDICTPPYVHEEMIIRALRAGKHVICEKPISGYFGADSDKAPIGETVPKAVMYDRLLSSLLKIGQVVKESGRKFMYAENFVYAPAVMKAAEIITAKKSRILYLKGEESLKGSSSPVAGEWNKTGGGTFIRTGSHPLSAILWLKQKEAQARGVKITPSTVMADMARITPSLTEYEHRHIAARPADVEDCGTVILTFSDGSRGVVIATDTLLGGSKNTVELYCNDAAINCRLTMNDAMSTYLLDEDGMEDVYLSEMLPSRIGWNKPFIADDVVRGYTDEMQDFMECICMNREPESNFRLACDTIKVIYGAYKSAEEGRVVELDERKNESNPLLLAG
jgi:predicted dehydrogenase